MPLKSHKTFAMEKQALKVLRKIVPWLSESESSSQYRTNHKGTHGRIGIVGGARDYTGAPFFASMSAMRLGADLAYVVCSREASQVIKSYSPDLIVTPLLDHPEEAEFDKEMACLLSRLHALVIGPGLGRETLLQVRARRLINQAKARALPLILDADSLILINEDPSIIKSYPKALLTPNRIELQRLLENTFPKESFDLRNTAQAEVQQFVHQLSKELDVTILAKGLADIICDNSDKPLELVTDLSGSSRRCGGQGDITCGLAGVYSHWIEQANKKSQKDGERISNPMGWAGFLAAMTTRRCNEQAYKEFKNEMLASDMIPKIGQALNSMLEEAEASRHETSATFNYAGVLSRDEIGRYARQMIMSEFGPTSQSSLKRASALIIGAGGLGCPAAVYLGAAGIGTLGVVDDDRVEASNLHRQILHNMDKLGMLKTESVEQSVKSINPNVRVITHSVKMDRFNAVDLIEQYDIILDCTDNLLSRYMISDACVVAKRPLISGAALKMDGQLTVYNYDSESPCFRCLFPEPPTPNAVGSCSENGVLGVIPGVIGVQQALEAIKIGAGIKPAYSGKMLLFDGQLGLFRHIKLSKRKNDCDACGSRSKLGRSLIDYNEFCGEICKIDSQVANRNVLADDERVTVEQYSEVLLSKRPHVLVDVRPKEQSDISRLENSLQLPVMHMMNKPEETKKLVSEELRRKNSREIFVVCRKGIASQRGARLLQDLLKDEGVVIKDVIGGMTTWAKKIDPQNYACV